MQPWRPFQLPLLPFPGTCSLTPAVLASHILWTHDTCSSLMTCALFPLPGVFPTASPNCDIFSSYEFQFKCHLPQELSDYLIHPVSPLIMFPALFCLGFTVLLVSLFLSSSLQGGALSLLFGASPKTQETVWHRDDGQWCF